MKILALDAATEACSVALQIDGEVFSRYEVAPQQHSQKLLPMVDEVLNEAGVSLAELDGLAFGQGPGSFTGVRIGVAITQGLAFAADLPVVGVSNLAAMAQQVIAVQKLVDGQDVLVAIDARMSEVYWGHYRVAGGLAQLQGNEIVVAPEKTPSLGLAAAYRAGTGWQTYQTELLALNQTLESDITLPNAEFLLPLAAQQFNTGHGVAAELAQPNYVRDEVSWQKLPGR